MHHGCRRFWAAGDATTGNRLDCSKLKVRALRIDAQQVCVIFIVSSRLHSMVLFIIIITLHYIIIIVSSRLPPDDFLVFSHYWYAMPAAFPQCCFDYVYYTYQYTV